MYERLFSAQEDMGSFQLFHKIFPLSLRFKMVGWNQTQLFAWSCDSSNKIQSQYGCLESRKAVVFVAYGKNTDLLRPGDSFNILQGGSVTLGLSVSQFF